MVNKVNRYTSIQGARAYLIAVLTVLLLAGCSNLPLPGRSTDTPTPPAPTETPTLPPTDTPTPTSLPPLLVLLIPPEADLTLAANLEPQFAQLAREEGLRFQIRQSITEEETVSEADYLIALPPAPGLGGLVAAAPDTRFLAVGVPDLAQSPNLIAIGSNARAPDQTAFLAGYIAAITTPEYRTGVIGLEDSEHAEVITTTFENGMRFYCGLCRSGVPPFYEYPMFIQLPSTATDVEWRAIADFMVDRVVRTVYVVPGAGGDWDEELLRYLTEQSIYVIGEVKPPQDIPKYWMASIRQPNLEGIYLEYWPQLISGDTGVMLPLPVQLMDINPELFSPGRQRLAQDILADLEAGLIDTGGTDNGP
jgi:hypothetical protein